MEKTDIDELMWSDWTVQSILGKGSYGTVYKVKKNSFRSEIYSAVKHLSIPYESSEIATIRSEGMTKKEIKLYYQGIVNNISDEIRLMDSLKGTTNIVSIEDFKITEKKYEIGWDVLIRMELLSDLNEYFENKSGSIADIIKVGIDICNALECCRKANIIHRDIKPENIFVNKFGDFKLGDFGIAREYSQTRADMSMRGTPYYIAPEVYEGKEYDSTVDIYSLGIVLYRLLNRNRLPFFPLEGTVSFNERNDALRRRLSGEEFQAPVNSIPELSKAIFKACAPNPDDRFQSPQEFKNALSEALNIILFSENPPHYNFYNADDKNYEQSDSIKGSTYDLSTGTVLLPENVDENLTFLNKNYKKIIAVSSVVLILIITIAIFAGAKETRQPEDYITDNTSTVTQQRETSSKSTESISEKTTTKKDETTTSSSATTAKYTQSYTTKRVTKKTTTKKSTTTSKNTTKKRTTKKTTTTRKSTTKKKTTKKSVSVGSVGSVSALKSGNNVRATWSSVSNASEYYVTINGPGGQRSKNTTLTSTQFPLNDYGTYRITVTPIGPNGEKGSSSSASYTYKE